MYDIMLEDPGRLRVKVTKAVRTVCKTDLKSAYGKVEAAPVALGVSLAGDELKDSVALLRDAGASVGLVRLEARSDIVKTVSIRPSGMFRDPDAGWLVLDASINWGGYLADMNDGQEDETWEVRFGQRTRAELDSLPEHDGW